MQPDFQCTWWPDNWFGINITQCCVAHDLGGTDWQLASCVADLHPAFLVLGIVMFVGVTLGRPIYRAWQRRSR